MCGNCREQRESLDNLASGGSVQYVSGRGADVHKDMIPCCSCSLHWLRRPLRTGRLAPQAPSYHANHLVCAAPLSSSFDASGSEDAASTVRISWPRPPLQARISSVPESIINSAVLSTLLFVHAAFSLCEVCASWQVLPSSRIVPIISCRLGNQLPATTCFDRPSRVATSHALYERSSCRLRRQGDLIEESRANSWTHGASAP